MNRGCSSTTARAVTSGIAASRPSGGAVRRARRGKRHAGRAGQAAAAAEDRRRGRGAPGRASRAGRLGRSRAPLAAAQVRRASRAGRSCSSRSAKGAGGCACTGSRTARCRSRPTSPSASTSPSATRPSHSRDPGSAAAPTAVSTSRPSFWRRSTSRRVTLHLGLDNSDRCRPTRWRTTSFTASGTKCGPEAWKRIEGAERVLAVGTTTVRVLESVARGAPLAGRTELFILPGFESAA